MWIFYSFTQLNEKKEGVSDRMLLDDFVNQLLFE